MSIYFIFQNLILGNNFLKDNLTFVKMAVGEVLKYFICDVVIPVNMANF